MDPILENIVSILKFVIVFGLLVFLHEFGHYIMSKLFHIEVEEFGFGFPPRLVKLFQFRETEFTLNWIPFGAFVRPKGENDPNVAGGLAAASPWARLGVLFGGPVMNLATGVLLFSLVYAQVGAPVYSQVLIAGVVENTPAEKAGIQTGDIVVSIDGEPIDHTRKLRKMVRSNLDQEIEITLLRGDELVVTKATPRSNPPEGEGELGIGMTNPIEKVSWAGTIPASIQTGYEQIYQLIALPGQLIRGEISPEAGRMVGVVGIYSIFDQIAELDAEDAAASSRPEPLFGLNTIYFMATISIALGITNLLPVPALDGGRILFVLPEILFRRRVPAEYENMIHLIGFAALIILMIYITAQDIINPITIPK